MKQPYEFRLCTLAEVSKITSENGNWKEYIELHFNNVIFIVFLSGYWSKLEL